MSKRQLINFLNDLDQEELKEQVIDLYARFKEVKTFYDFSFNPNENKLSDEAKLKIAKEYFPEGKRRAKKRRSVAQKIIVKLQKLEANPMLIADIMLYNIEIAQTYCADTPINQESFYKSMLTSFRAALVFISTQFLESDFEQRIEKIIDFAKDYQWLNSEGFIKARRELMPSRS
jgi:hypothetical protein